MPDGPGMSPGMPLSAAPIRSSGRSKRLAGADPYAAVAVASDGSALTSMTDWEPAVVAVLNDYAAVLRHLAGLDAIAVPVLAGDGGELAACLGALPRRVGTIFLVDTDPARAATAQQVHAGPGGLPIVTDHDTTAIALTAATLTTLHRIGAAPAGSQVVISGANRQPALARLLVAAGIGDLVLWNETDAGALPLRTVVPDATAVIDLVGATASMVVDSATAMITPADPDLALLAAPGLLRTVLQIPHLDADPATRVNVHLACARALQATTPADRLVPELTDPDLTRRVTFAAARSLHQWRGA